MKPDVEDEIRHLSRQGQHEAAVARGLEGYGPEVLGFLAATLRSQSDAGEVFSATCEDLWRGFPQFQWKCSFRTWLYTLARNAASHYRRSPHHRAGLRADTSELGELALRIRTSTLPHLRTEVKDRFAALRSELDPDEQALLILRVDKEMPWVDVARVLCGEPEPSDAQLRQLSVTLRKRFQALKDELRQRARRAGLLPDETVD